MDIKKLINRNSGERILVHVILLGIVGISLFPFYWMFVVGSNTTSVVSRIPPVVIPGRQFVENLLRAAQQINFSRGLLNSSIVAGSITVSVLFLSSLAGFAFAKLNFPGKKYLFLFVLGTMMVPMQLGMIPQYMIMQTLGWVSDFRAVIVPSAVTAFGVFWMRQYITSAVPNELLEAGRLEGCGYFMLYRYVVVPLIPAAFATLGIITFMQFWNDFMWPLIVLRDRSVHTIQIMLRTLEGAYFIDYSMVLAATFMATLPMLIVFLIFNRQFISGVADGAVKG